MLTCWWVLLFFAVDCSEFNSSFLRFAMIRVGLRLSFVTLAHVAFVTLRSVEFGLGPVCAVTRSAALTKISTVNL